MMLCPACMKFGKNIEEKQLTHKPNKNLNINLKKELEKISITQKLKKKE